MIELISIVCSLAICILTPIEVARIRRGWVRPKFAGDREKFLTAYRRQLTLLTWLGIVFGALSVGLAFIEIHPGEGTVKFIAAAIWLAVACISFVSRRLIAGVSVARSVQA
jgi:hypothetical protein